MSQAFEKFLHGEDRLARLLCELPVYSPSAEFEAAFARAARAAQAAQGARMATQTAAAATQTESTTRPTAPGAAPCEAIASAFEPPASLEASFLKMAARIDSAQAPRREAVLTGVAKGGSPQALLGTAIAPASEEWLRAQAAAVAPAQPAPPSPAVEKRAFLGFRWFDLRLAALACLLAAIGTQLVLTHYPDAQQVAGQAAFQTAMVTKEVPSKAEFAAREPEAAPSPLKKNTAAALPPHPRPAASANSPPPDSSSPPAPRTLADAVEAPARPLDGKATGPGTLASGNIALPEAGQAERKAAAEDAVSTAAGKPRPAMLAASPKVAPAPTPMARQHAAETSTRATLADDPARIASQLPARPAGAVWTVYSSRIGQPELEHWLEALRRQIPETIRPARFELIQDDTSGGPNDLRIVPPAPPERR